jgi:hypothetical protein
MKWLSHRSAYANFVELERLNAFSLRIEFLTTTPSLNRTLMALVVAMTEYKECKESDSWTLQMST